MLNNEKLIARLSFIVLVILTLDALFVHFNDHMWPILNIYCFEIYALPLALIPLYGGYNFSNIRNNKYLRFLAYTLLALNTYRLIYNIIN